MSIRQVTSSLSDGAYVRALEQELAEREQQLKSVQSRVDSLERRPRIATAAPLTVDPETGDPVRDPDLVPVTVDDPRSRFTPDTPVAFGATSTAAFGPTGALNAAVHATFFPVATAVNGDLIDITKHELYGRRADTGEVWRRLTTGSGTVSTLDYDPLPPGETWQFKVRAISGNGTPGAFTAPIALVMSADITPPPTPSVPSLSTRLGTVTVSWDGLGSGGETQPVDFDRCDVLVNGQVAGAIKLSSGASTFVLTGLAYLTSYTIRLVAVDTSGNRSPQSAPANVIVQPLVDTDLIGQIINGANIKDGTITASDKIIANTITGGLIQALAIDAGKIAANAITTDKLAAGAITAEKLAVNSVTASNIMIGDFANLANNDDWSLGAPSWVIPTGGTTIYSPSQPQSNNGYFIRLPMTQNEGQGLRALGPKFNAVAGEQFSISANVYANGTATGGLVGLELIWFRQDGTSQTQLAVTLTPTFPAGYVTYTATLTAPANVVAAQFSFVTVGKATQTAGAIATFANPMVRRMVAGSLIVDGAIDGKTITGALVRSAASGARTEMTNQGIRVIDGTGVEQVRLGYGIATGMSVLNPNSGSLVPLSSIAFGTTSSTGAPQQGVLTTGTGTYSSLARSIAPAAVSSASGRMLVMMSVNLSLPPGAYFRVRAAVNTAAPPVAGGVNDVLGTTVQVQELDTYNGGLTSNQITLLGIVNVTAGASYRAWAEMQVRGGTAGGVWGYVRLDTVVAFPI